MTIKEEVRSLLTADGQGRRAKAETLEHLLRLVAQTPACFLPILIKEIEQSLK